MIRLTGGIFRGRVIQTPSQFQTRPTQARLRQAWFNSLQSHIPEAKVLDLFAGSGALGFEALSRGAHHVTFVEQSKSALSFIKRNAKDLKVESQIRILGGSVDSVISTLKKEGPFQIVLADPPYEEGWEMKLLNYFPWEEILAAGGYFCLEWGIQKSQISELPEHSHFLTKVREKKYGDSVLTTYLKGEK
jgi:16S rRNA (guanine966-N2)-methyltransferase